MVLDQSEQLEPHAAKPTLSATSATSSEEALEPSPAIDITASTARVPSTKKQGNTIHPVVRDRLCPRCSSKSFKGTRRDDPDALYCSDRCQFFAEKSDSESKPTPQQLRTSKDDFKIKPLAHCARCNKEVYTETVVCDGEVGSEIFCSFLCQRAHV